MALTIDLRHLSMIGGHQDPELREIIDDFVTELGDHLEKAESYLGENKVAVTPTEIREMAHKIRGMAGALGFKPLSDLAAVRDIDQPFEAEVEWVTNLRVAIVSATDAWNELKSSEAS